MSQQRQREKKTYQNLLREEMRKVEPVVKMDVFTHVSRHLFYAAATYEDSRRFDVLRSALKESTTIGAKLAKIPQSRAGGRSDKSPLAKRRIIQLSVNNDQLSKITTEDEMAKCIATEYQLTRYRMNIFANAALFCKWSRRLLDVIRKRKGIASTIIARCWRFGRKEERQK